MRTLRSGSRSLGHSLSVHLLTVLVAMAGLSPSMKAVANAGAMATPSLPYDISPEAVQALKEAGMPVVFVDADAPKEPRKSTQTVVRTVYYTTSPSFRSARHRVVEDRNAGLSSQRLSGTPAEWRRLKLEIDPAALPTKAVSLTPKQVADAIKDGADIDLVDLRPVPVASPAQPSSFPQALRLMPHELETGLAALSKQRWVILIDSGHREALPIADWLARRGYPLVAYLEGGYPAWVQSTER